jgi:hypothetical protein
MAAESDGERSGRPGVKVQILLLVAAASVLGLQTALAAEVVLACDLRFTPGVGGATSFSRKGDIWILEPDANIAYRRQKEGSGFPLKTTRYEYQIRGRANHPHGMDLDISRLSGRLTGDWKFGPPGTKRVLHHYYIQGKCAPAGATKF